MLFIQKKHLPKIKDREYVISFDKFKSLGTHWIALCMNENNIVYLKNCNGS